MKVCTDCKIEKPLDYFVKRSNRKNGFQPYCKECHKSKMSKIDRKEYTRNYDLLKSYSITIEGYNELLAKQGGCCSICNINVSELKGAKKHLCVDHCHKTGRIRGLLCDKCNRGIGLLQDDTAIIQNALVYLHLF